MKKVDREPTPELSKLVDREKEIADFEQTLTKVQQKRPVSTTLYEWHGGPGIGKSQLVRMLAQACNRQAAPWVSVNFKAPQAREYVKDPSRLIEDLVADRFV